MNKCVSSRAENTARDLTTAICAIVKTAEQDLDMHARMKRGSVLACAHMLSHERTHLRRVTRDDPAMMQPAGARSLGALRQPRDDKQVGSRIGLSIEN